MDWPDTITLDGPDRAGNLEKWRQLTQQYAPSAETFEVHCWEDESGPIALARRYGCEKDTGWERGIVIAGAATPEFREMLLAQPLPAGCEACQKLTPFFSVFLDNGFSSEHYGTEINICKEETP